jgi:hypothetical protein
MAMKTLMAGALIAGALMGSAAIAQADPTTTPDWPNDPPARHCDPAHSGSGCENWAPNQEKQAICDNSYWRRQFPGDCAGW